MLLAPISMSAQEIKLSGTINDVTSKESVSDASITIKEKLIGTTTDSKGNFNLYVTKMKLPFTIVVSSINHEEKEMLVSDVHQRLSINLEKKSVF